LIRKYVRANCRRTPPGPVTLSFQCPTLFP